MSDTPNKTTYVMLRGNGTGAWSVQGQVDAPGAAAAVKQFLATKTHTDEQGGQWVAVPFRSWQPVQVQAQVVTTTRLVPVTPLAHPEPAPVA